MTVKNLLRASALWFIFAFGMTLFIPPPAASGAVRTVIVAGPLLALTLLYSASSGFRGLLNGLPLRAFVGIHLIRALVGGIFLVLGNRGGLPMDFALPAGVGDILAGMGALALLAAPRWQGQAIPVLLALWSLFGIADFLNVQRIVLAMAAQGRGGEFAAMQGPPLALVPYFGVPLLFFTHIHILVRCLGAIRRGAALENRNVAGITGRI